MGQLTGAFVIYPSTTEYPAPAYSEVVITSTVPVALIEYAVSQPPAGEAEVAIRASASGAAEGSELTWMSWVRS